MSKIKKVEETQIQYEESLYIKYRPETLDEVIGHDTVVKSLKKLFSAPTVPHAFLFSGDSGVGKTTIARCLKGLLGITENHQVIEVDAGLCNSAEEMRELMTLSKMGGFRSKEYKLIIIDEIQNISKQAFTILLKTLEEPPCNLFFAICTTELNKIPQAIKTRCSSYVLNKLSREDMATILEEIVEQEELVVDKKAIGKIIAEANGSPRAAISMLTTVVGLSGDELLDVLDSPEQNTVAFEIAKKLVYDRKAKFKDFTKLLQNCGDTSETIRILIVRMTSNALLKATKDDDIMHLLAILENFSTPHSHLELFAPLLLALGNLFYLHD